MVAAPVNRNVPSRLRLAAQILLLAAAYATAAWRRRDGKVFVGISVTGPGIGITPDQATRVCERFYRADTSAKIPGSGLGMAIIKEIVELLGRPVEIVSAPEIGTAVTVWLLSADGTHEVTDISGAAQ